jgi:uncharacterized membrane protein YraQ (UPF0718 family)
MIKNILKYSFAILFILLIGLSWLFDIAAGKSISENFWDFFTEMIIFLPLMFLLVGLFDVWVPRDKVVQHIGEESGIKGTFLVILLAMQQAGPLYGAFPFAYILWKKGCSVKNIFIYLGAYSTIKIPMLTFEIGFLGVNFSLLRTLVTLPVFIVIGYAMERIIGSRNFRMYKP